MQMTGNGIICTGYFYYSPSAESFSVSSSSNTSKSFSPSVGKSARITFTNTDYYSVRVLTWTLSGTYVNTTQMGVGSATNPSGNTGSVSAQSSTTVTPPYVRYA